MIASIRRKPASHQELDLFEEHQRKIEEQIAALQDLPKQLEEEERERARTLPPSDDILRRAKEREFEERAGRNQVRNERRSQGRSLLLLLLLLAATAATVGWVVSLVNR